MTIETLKSPNPRNRNSISVIKSKFLSASSMNTLLAIFCTEARRDVTLAGGLSVNRTPKYRDQKFEGGRGVALS